MKKFRIGLVGLLVVAAASNVPWASADPDAVAEAQAELERIQEEAAQIDADIIAASERVTDAETKLATLTDDLATQQAKVDQLGLDLGDVAMLQLNSGGFDITNQLLSSATDSSFLSGLATIQNEAARSNADIQALQVEQARLDSLTDQQERLTASLVADQEAKEQLAADYDAKEDEAQAVYDQLSEEERQRLAALEAERQAAAAEAAEPTPDAGSEDSDQPAPAVSGSASERAAQAANIALAQAGKSYVWGATGPNSFDCSGLMIYAYSQVGISLPRTSGAQYNAGTAVSRSDLQPGDLVFYYSGISHVGMYIGNGQIIHAANPSSGVRVAGLDSMPYMGARRVA